MFFIARKLDIQVRPDNKICKSQAVLDFVVSQGCVDIAYYGMSLTLMFNVFVVVGFCHCLLWPSVRGNNVTFYKDNGVIINMIMTE